MNSTELVRKKFLVMFILLLLMFCCVNNIAAQEANKWEYEFTLYGWFPSINGDLKYNLPGDAGSSASIDPSEILDSLNMIFMGSFEARHNKLSFATDIIYMDLSDSNSTNITLGPNSGLPVSASVNLGLTSWVITGVVGYDVVQTDRARLAVIGGVRYLAFDADTDLSINGPLPPTPLPATLSESVDLWDVIVGIRGGVMLNKHWFIPYYADIGAGDSELTYQLYAGIGYMFHWGDIKLGYRYLKYDQGDDKFLQDIEFYGPLLGIGFRF